MKKGLQIFLGIVSSTLIWTLIVLLCGQIPLGDMFCFHRLKFGFFAPLFLLLYVILIAVLGKKKDAACFFKSAILTFTLPLFFGLIGNLLTFFTFSTGLILLSNYFGILGAPMFSVLCFFAEYFSQDALYILVYLFLLLLPGLSALVYHFIKEKTMRV